MNLLYSSRLQNSGNKCFDIRPALWEYRNDFSVVNLICNSGKNILRVHKMILAASSDLMKRELEKSCDIFVGFIEPQVVSLLLKFIYHGEIKFKLQNLTQFAILGKKLQIRGFPGRELFEFLSTRNKYLSRISCDEKYLPVGDKICDENIKTELADNLENLELAERTNINRRLNITDLPNELLLKIFTFLPTETVLCKIAPVCKLFRDLSKDPDAHHRVTISSNMDIEQASHMLNSATKMRELRIHDHCHNVLQISHERSYDTPEPSRNLNLLLAAIMNHTMLQKVLVESRCMHATLQFFTIFCVSPVIARLNTLILPVQGERDMSSPDFEDLNMILSKVAAEGTLKCINIDGKELIGNNVVVNFATKARGLKYLSTLEAIDEDSLVTILNRNKDTLEEINVPNAIWTPEALEVFSQCHQLTNANLAFESYSEKLFQGLPHMKNLKMISVTLQDDRDVASYQKLVNEHEFPQLSLVEFLFQPGTRCNAFLNGMPEKFLRKLYLVAIQINDSEGVEASTISNLIQKCPNLEIFLIFFQSPPRFKIQDVFENVSANHVNLEFIIYDFNTGVSRKDAKFLFQRFKKLKCVVIHKTLIVKRNVEIKDAMNCRQLFPNIVDIVVL